jgi:Tfp pilus assembly protein PilP
MLLKKLKINLTNLFLLTFMLFANNNDLKAREIEQVFKDMSSIENPLSIRDPFQPPKMERAKKDGEAQTPVRNGVFTNIPQINNVKLEDISIVGVIIGPERRAFVKKGTDKTIYTLTEGMKLGANNAEIKAILPGGIILVEKVTNIYGEDEFLETVIPLSQ